MAYDNSVKEAAYRRIKQLTTEDVRFDGSQWWHQRANGHWQIAPGNAAFYTAILDAEQDKVVASKAKAAPAPSPPAATPPPAPSAPAIPTMSASHALASYTPMSGGGLHLPNMGGMLSAGAGALGVGAGLLGSLGTMVMQGVTMAATTIVGVATAAIGTVTGIAVASLLASKDYAAQVWRMSVSSGMSANAAGSNVMHLRALGLHPDDVPGLSQNVMMQSMMAPMLGMSGPGDLLGAARMYQARKAQGPLGLMMAQGMLGAGGYAGAETTLAMPLPLLQRQIARSDQMTGAFGVKPDDIVKSQQNLSMLMSSWSQFIELAKLKITDTLSPLLTGMLDKAVSFVSTHGPEISKFIEDTVTGAIHWFGVLANFAVNTLPVAVATGLSFMLKAGATVAEGLATGFTALSDNMPDLLRGLDGIIDFTHEMIATGKGLVAGGKAVWNTVTGHGGGVPSGGGGWVGQVGGYLQQALPYTESFGDAQHMNTKGRGTINAGLGSELFQGAKEWLWPALAKSPAAREMEERTLLKMSGRQALGLGLVGAAGAGILMGRGAYGDARDAAIAGYQPSHLALDYTKSNQEWLTGKGGAAEKALAAAKWMRGGAQGMDDFITGHQGKQFDFDAFMAEVKRGNDIAQKIADNTGKTVSGLTNYGANIIGVMSAQQSQDIAANIMSTSPTQ